MTEANKEYAVALNALARETGQADAWGEGLRRIEAALKADPDWAQLLSCPAVPLREREALIEEAFSASLPGELIALVKLLCERGRMGQFHAVEAEYLHMLDSMNLRRKSGEGGQRRAAGRGGADPAEGRPGKALRSPGGVELLGG